MTTETTILKIAHGALGSAYLDTIKVMYQQAVEDGVFETVESEYVSGIDALNSVFSSEQTERLAEYEHTCSSIRDYSARYGFLAGLYCGFKQYFTPEVEDDGGFMKYVNDEIGRKPRMKHHKEYFDDVVRRNKLACAMEEETDDMIRYHVVSVESAWGQRAYSASIDGFYLGYRAAIAILEKVEPQNWPALAMERNLLMMEHRLGVIKSYEEIERDKERNPA